MVSLQQTQRGAPTTYKKQTFLMRCKLVNKPCVLISVTEAVLPTVTLDVGVHYSLHTRKRDIIINVDNNIIILLVYCCCYCY